MNTNTFALSQFPTKENQLVEFKSSITNPTELAKKLGIAISGFANSGGGTFIAGVDNVTGNADGGLAIEQFVGRQNLRDWADQEINHVTPTPCYDIKLIRDADGRGVINAGKAVLVVSIEESHIGPHMAPDYRYYIRAGAHTIAATHFLVEALWAKRHFAKPRLTHLIRQNPDDTEIIQVGLVALTDSPAISVQLEMEPLPGLLRGHKCSEFPVHIAVIDKYTPFFFDITTRCDMERNQNEEFDLRVNYLDLASDSYQYESKINLFRALPSLRFGKKGVNEIAKALESIALIVSSRDIGPLAGTPEDERDVYAIWRGVPIRPATRPKDTTEE